MKNVLTILLTLVSIVGISQEDRQSPGCLDSLEIPSSFTPNGDNVNDLFMIVFPCVPENFTITIYNRWGEELFKSKDPGFSWNGTTTKGDPLPVGSYHFKINFTDSGEKKELLGDVVIMR